MDRVPLGSTWNLLFCFLSDISNPDKKKEIYSHRFSKFKQKTNCSRGDLKRKALGAAVRLLRVDMFKIKIRTLRVKGVKIIPGRFLFP